MELPRTIHTHYGVRCTAEQLAAAAGHENARSGAFMRKVSASLTYGLIERDGDEFKLTDTGRQIVREDTAPQAKARAFLNVELHKKLFDEFKSGSLPMDKALENMIRELGVAPKQVEVARQVFRRAADQAGFFPFGKDRLVAPAALTGTGASIINTEHEVTLGGDAEARLQQLENELAETKRALLEAERKSAAHQLSALPVPVTGLLMALPTSADQAWTSSDLTNWMKTFQTVLEFAFRDRIKPSA